jgi:hypothetical protein
MKPENVYPQDVRPGDTIRFCDQWVRVVWRRRSGPGTTELTLSTHFPTVVVSSPFAAMGSYKCSARPHGRSPRRPRGPSRGASAATAALSSRRPVPRSRSSRSRAGRSGASAVRAARRAMWGSCHERRAETFGRLMGVERDPRSAGFGSVTEADDGSRTRDLWLGKPTLYQLSYVREVSPQFRARLPGPVGLGAAGCQALRRRRSRPCRRLSAGSDPADSLRAGRLPSGDQVGLSMPAVGAECRSHRSAGRRLRLETA